MGCRGGEDEPWAAPGRTPAAQPIQGLGSWTLHTGKLAPKLRPQSGTAPPNPPAAQAQPVLGSFLRLA